MKGSFIECYREKAVTELFSMNTFAGSFPVWWKSIEEILSNRNYESDALLEVGANLRRIFKETGKQGRGQSSVSGGGAAWEGLACWYLNLCLVGSSCVVIKQKKHLVPEPIAKSLTVMYGSQPSNTESDLIAITFPVDVNDSLQKSSSRSDIGRYCKTNFEDLEVCVIQCKTNWNDNAQIPMLWDIIYNSAGNISAATVGIDNYKVSDLKRFSYAFVTVPSQQDLSIYKTTSTAVLRVEKLTGGNYWGATTKPGVALSLNEILNKNFQTAQKSLASGWRTHIEQVLQELSSTYSYFKN